MSLSISSPQRSPAGAFDPLNVIDVLVVDDNVTLRSLLLGFLRSHGYQVECADNGRHALRLLRAQPARLVLTDIYMPETDGLELIAQLRKTEPKPRILAMSGDGSAAPDLALKTACQLGAHQVLFKPFPLAELLEQVRGALGR